MAKLREFGLEQRVVARVVHQAQVIFKFRIETDRKNIFLKRNRLGIHKITAGERTDPANRVHQFDPKSGQVGVAADVSRRICRDCLGTCRSGSRGGFIARTDVRGCRSRRRRDACATFDLEGLDGVLIPAQILHDTGLAELHGEFAVVLPTEAILELL